MKTEIIDLKINNLSFGGSKPSLLTKLLTMATLAQKSRQSRALAMLEAQLKSGVKTQKGTSDVKIALTDADRKRINKEIDILKAKA
jgi:hypothetical protein